MSFDASVTHSSAGWLAVVHVVTWCRYIGVVNDELRLHYTASTHASGVAMGWAKSRVPGETMLKIIFPLQ